jgi:hypothetical protein
MTLGGWINLTLSVGTVTLLFVWCIYRVVCAPKTDGSLAHVEPIDESHAD